MKTLSFLALSLLASCSPFIDGGKAKPCTENADCAKGYCWEGFCVEEAQSLDNLAFSGILGPDVIDLSGTYEQWLLLGAVKNCSDSGGNCTPSVWEADQDGIWIETTKSYFKCDGTEDDGCLNNPVSSVSCVGPNCDNFLYTDGNKLIAFDRWTYTASTYQIAEPGSKVRIAASAGHEFAAVSIADILDIGNYHGDLLVYSSDTILFDYETGLSNQVCVPVVAFGQRDANLEKVVCAGGDRSIAGRILLAEFDFDGTSLSPLGVPYEVFRTSANASVNTLAVSPDGGVVAVVFEHGIGDNRESKLLVFENTGVGFNELQVAGIDGQPVTAAFSQGGLEDRNIVVGTDTSVCILEYDDSSGSGAYSADCPLGYGYTMDVKYSPDFQWRALAEKYSGSDYMDSISLLRLSGQLW